MARRNRRRLNGVLGLAMLLAGCRTAQKEATEAAVKAAETALSTVEGEGAKYTPEQLVAARRMLLSAREAIARGDYVTAVEGAKDVAERVRGIAVAAPAKKQEWTRAWADLQESIPESLEAIQGRLELFARTGRVPVGMDTEIVSGAQERYAKLNQQWVNAVTEAHKGNLGQALKMTEGLPERLAELKDLLGAKP